MIGKGKWGLDEEVLLQIYRKLLKIRLFEEAADRLFMAGKLPGAIHTCIGQEAVAVGVIERLDPADLIVGNHRSHGHCIAKGVPINKMLAELFGKKTGISEGKAGSLHIADPDRGMLGAIAVVGRGMPIATGVALGLKMRKEKRVCVCFFGDGAANAGVFHESMNMASLWKLPVVFVCENNLYGLSNPFRNATAIENIADRAAGFNMPGKVLDGMDVFSVMEGAREAINLAREGGGPSLLECKTYRFLGHSRGDPAYGPYRSKEEVMEWKKRDPIQLFLEATKLSVSKLREIEKEVVAEVEKGVQFAEESPYPEAQIALKDVYFEEGAE